jgi:hypothetical protein
MTSAEIFLIVATINGPLPLATFTRTAFGGCRMFFFHGRMGLRVIRHLWKPQQKTRRPAKICSVVSN